MPLNHTRASAATLLHRLCHPHAMGLLGVALAVALTTGLAPRHALAETSAELQAQLDDAKSQLSVINEQLMAAGEELNETLYQLDETNARIDAKQAEITETQEAISASIAELEERRGTLSDRIAANYKAGGNTLIDILLDSQSFEDFVSRVYYADKLAAADEQAIQVVNDLTAQLEEQKATLEEQRSALEEERAAQEELAAQQRSQQAALADQVASQEAYVSNLSEEVQAALEAEAEAERKRQEEEAAAAQAAAEAALAQAQSQASQSGSGSGSSGSAPATVSTPASVSGDARSIILAAAYSCIGTPYVFGASTPGVAIDCSGLTSYAYAAAGLSIPHSSAAQRAMTNVKPISQCQPGDLVFWYGHVAIYVGNGRIVHATYGGACEQALYGDYLGGGCPFNI